jgi:ABC-2 type transport system permease protein
MISAFLTSVRREVNFLRHSVLDLALVSWIPLLLMSIIAWQMSPAVLRNLPIAVVDLDRTGMGRALTHRLEAAPGLTVAATPRDFAEAESLARARRVFAIVLIPVDAAADLVRKGQVTVVSYYNTSYYTPGTAAQREITATVRDYAETLSREQTAATQGVTSVRPAAVAAQTTILFNPQGSYEIQLVSLLHPAILLLIFMICVVGALGRELRDGTIGEWLGVSPAHGAAAVAGKIAPYLLAFMLWAGVSLSYITARGWPMAGSGTVILGGYLALFLAHAGLALLLIGLTYGMAQSLSLTGLYAGSSFAFSGAIFPIQSASWFGQVWSRILPYSEYAKLQAEQMVMGTDAAWSFHHVAIMLVFFVIGTAVGLPRYLRAATQPALWGRR